jgi:hypothetical protein
VLQKDKLKQILEMTPKRKKIKQTDKPKTKEYQPRFSVGVALTRTGETQIHSYAGGNFSLAGFPPSPHIRGIKRYKT